MIRDYVVLDLEMSGLNPARDRILEVGAVLVHEGIVTDTMEAMIQSDGDLNETVMNLTGITPEMLAGGQPLDEVMNQFLEFMGDLPLVGHNVIFDYSFVKQWAVNKRIPLQKMGVDTLKLARKLRPELEKKTLESLCLEYRIERKRCHRALDDAYATYQIFEILQKEFSCTEELLFEPKLLQYQAKRQTPATARQKKYLKELLDYHKISIEEDIEKLTRSEASRITDQLLGRYGKMGRDQSS